MNEFSGVCEQGYILMADDLLRPKIAKMEIRIHGLRMKLFVN